MGRCVFIGDEVSAAGLRLAGVDCHVPAAAETADLFRRLRGSSGLIMITAELAAHLPEGLLADAVREQRPPVMVVADIRGRAAPPDVAAALKRQLGLAE
ncbi:MAG: V-type ATP synthase subunit F [Thiohalocapsa sp.]|jgi:vacuolar-type H+-ATPase subunit F/Vma7